jgi:hypothetical protein
LPRQQKQELTKEIAANEKVSQNQWKQLPGQQSTLRLAENL